MPERSAASRRDSPPPLPSGRSVLAFPAGSRFPALLALVTLAGAILRIRVAATEPPHFDESYTAAGYVLGTLGDLLTTYDEPNNHVFHSLLAWASTGLFGDGPLALRLPALVAGILLVPATGLLARATVQTATRDHGRPSEPGLATAAAAVPAPSLPAANHPAATAGLVAAGIVAAAPPLIAYSANARGYTIVLLLMVMQLGLSLRLSGRHAVETHRREPAATRVSVDAEIGSDARTGSARPTWWPWVAWIACGALAIWTVPTAVVGVLVAAIWLLALRSGPARRAIAPLVALAATGAASLALYAPLLGQRGFTVDRFTAAPVKQLGTTLVHAWTAGLAGPLIAVAIVLAAMGVARRPRLGSGAPLAIGLLALPLTIAAVGRVLPYSRTYLFLLPILAVLAGVGAARAAPWIAKRGRLASITAAAALAAIALAAGAGAQTREAWGEDPPGPDVHDVVAAYEAVRDHPLAGDLAHHPGASNDVQLSVAAPPFDAPQVRYAFLLPGDIESAYVATGIGMPVPPDFAGAILTRRDVDPAIALKALGLNPNQVVTTTIRGDAQAITVAPR